MLHRLSAFAVLLAVLAVPGLAADAPLDSLKEGGVALKSAGPLGFGPSGILFVGDAAAAKLYAIDTNDRDATEGKGRPDVDDLGGKIASLLGTEGDDITIKDIAVNPISGNTYLSVSRGSGPKAMPVILKVTPAGKISELDLKKVKSASAAIPNPAKGEKRAESITHIAFVKDRILVAGLSSEEFASNLRSIPFPFKKADAGSNVEIYHGAHGRWETKSPIRVFAPYKIGGEDHILAAYTCTPLVKLPLASVKAGEKVKGVTVAELGNMNRPLSMIVYKKGGKDFVLLANHARGLMRIPLAGVDKIEGITEKVKGKAGLKYDTITGVLGVQKIDAFGKGHVVLLTKTDDKTALKTIELP
jgi:hypothetical protein